MFLVYKPSSSACSGFSMTALILDLDVTRDSATYNCPCEKHGVGKYNPILCTVCPCALLMVIANAGTIGNCLRRSRNGKFLLSWSLIKMILGIKTSLPLCAPVMMVARMTCDFSSATRSRVPLHRPASGFKLRIIITGTPFLSINLSFQS